MRHKRLGRLMIGCMLFGAGAMGLGLTLTLWDWLSLLFAVVAAIGALLALWPSRKAPATGQNNPDRSELDRKLEDYQ